MFDLKMEAPSEIRGEFTPIDTKVPGIQICEHMPLIAKVMDKLVVIRSIVGATGGHDAIQCLTGRTNRNMPAGGRASIGPVLATFDALALSAVPAVRGFSAETVDILR